MCGICGIVDLAQNGYAPEMIKLMARSIVHRGPDEEGFHFDKKAGLGHKRLSIIDLSSGQQPMYNEDGSVVVVFNGEIFNFSELRENLLTCGHLFKTSSDTEVIVHAYEEYGFECVKHFRGEFAFALWDAKHELLYCARDRFGIKPFYYSLIDSKFIFSSECKSILASGLLSPKLDLTALNRYLCLGYVWGSLTLFKDIHKLPPATFAVIQNGQYKEECYWNIEDYIGKNVSKQSPVDSVKQLMRESVGVRMISDVPLGVLLSGGLDSSIITALMKEASPDKIQSFSVKFKNEDFDESYFSDLMAKRYGTNHTTLFGEDCSVDILETVAYHLDEPLADSATVPLYLISKVIRNRVTVVLSGDGGDEIFAGYNKYKLLLLKQMFSSVPFSGLLFKKVSKRLGIRDTFFSRKKECCQSYLDYHSSFNRCERSALFTDDSLSSDEEAQFQSNFKTKHDLLTSFQLFDLYGWLPNDILLKSDKMTMATSLEMRVPFLDHHVTQFAFGISSALRMHWLNGKYILKKAFSSMIPESIIKRKKQGFNYPLESVVTEEYLEKIFNESGLYAYLDKQKVKAIVDMRNKDRFVQKQFRTLLFLFIWHRLFIDEYERTVERFLEKG